MYPPLYIAIIIMVPACSEQALKFTTILTDSTLCLCVCSHYTPFMYSTDSPQPFCLYLSSQCNLQFGSSPHCIHHAPLQFTCFIYIVITIAALLNITGHTRYGSKYKQEIDSSGISEVARTRHIPGSVAACRGHTNSAQLCLRSYSAPSLRGQGPLH